MTALAPTLPAFFRDRLIDQRQANPHTIAAYRDTLRSLLFAFAQPGKEPSKLDIDDLNTPLVGACLDHLECQPENGVRTRNARLAAIRPLFRYVALRYRKAVIERVLVTFLTEAELEPAVPFYLPNFVINRRSVGVDTGRVGLSSYCLRISFPRCD